MQSDVGKALFLTSNKAVEHGLIGDDKDFFRKVCVKWKDTEIERQSNTSDRTPCHHMQRMQVLEFSYFSYFYLLKAGPPPLIWVFGHF